MIKINLFPQIAVAFIKMRYEFYWKHGQPKINTDITTTQVALNYVIAKGGVPLVEVNSPKQAEEDMATNNVRDLDLPLIMDEPIDIEVVRTEALRKLGRNIVNFSKIEGILKYLLSVTQIEGLSTSTRNRFVDNYERFRKHTLGMLVGKFHDTVLVDDSQSEAQPDSSEPGMSLSLKVSYSDSDFLNAQKQALLDIVAERNKLIIKI